MNDYLDVEFKDKKDEALTEQFYIGKTNIVVHNKGRVDSTDKYFDKFIATFTKVIKRIEKAGFGKAVKDLTVHVHFWNETRDLRGGDYDKNTDRSG